MHPRMLPLSEEDRKWQILFHSLRVARLRQRRHRSKYLSSSGRLVGGRDIRVAGCPPRPGAELNRGEGVAFSPDGADGAALTRHRRKRGLCRSRALVAHWAENMKARCVGRLLSPHELSFGPSDGGFKLRFHYFVSRNAKLPQSKCPLRASLAVLLNLLSPRDPPKD